MCLGKIHRTVCVCVCMCMCVRESVRALRINFSTHAPALLRTSFTTSVTAACALKRCN